MTESGRAVPFKKRRARTLDLRRFPEPETPPQSAGGFNAWPEAIQESAADRFLPTGAPRFLCPRLLLIKSVIKSH
jgi:hypothetical protein